jgi:hypothetical protein
MASARWLTASGLTVRSVEKLYTPPKLHGGNKRKPLI